jgi:hypothetical protein
MLFLARLAQVEFFIRKNIFLHDEQAREVVEQLFEYYTRQYK